jgi:hypothetical protein
MFGVTDSAFASQFERSGKGFIYRYNRRGRAIRVSAAERDAFVADFRRGYRLLIAGLCVAVVATFAVVSALGGLSDPFDPVMFVLGFAGIAMAFIGGIAWSTLRLLRTPERALANLMEGEARSREEMRRITLASFTYQQLALIAVASFAAFGFRPWMRGALQGWGLLWLAPGAALAILAAVQAFRKWRMER